MNQLLQSAARDAGDASKQTVSIDILVSEKVAKGVSASAPPSREPPTNGQEIVVRQRFSRDEQPGKTSTCLSLLAVTYSMDLFNINC